MNEPIVIEPNVKNFVQSLRDIGYSFEIGVADLVDNSISAKATNIKIYTAPQPNLIFCMLDNGIGMSEDELIEGMRLASKNPKDIRDKDDLGRFGLGLKTASFSQCKKLTVISKKDKIISSKQWDLDFISKKNKWLLITPDNADLYPLYSELIKSKSGTLVVWEKIDRYDKSGFSDNIDKLRKHLALVFHRFLEGLPHLRGFKITVNENPVKAFNPFNINHPATQQIAAEKIKLFGENISIQPFILPHHSKISRQEYEQYATEEGYIKSQGFYLYRANRILIYGTWWGLHRSTDAHKLVRVKIDIPNNIDEKWGIDIKKSVASPCYEIKKDLKRIINQITERGSRPFTGRGRKIEDKTVINFWEIKPLNNDLRFALNENHPIYRDLIALLNDDAYAFLNLYLKGIQAYLPLEAIQANLQKNPHEIKQETAFTEEDLNQLAKRLKKTGLTEEYINELLKTDVFRNKIELFKNGNK